ncbi:inactive transglutaminase family protein [Pseudomonas sp. F1_0610]|uniref:inactive transglutaminase family protein n=1 Tax=Pseudomonas sp. F1_0610 TaxID=3114284 RepID=UPI0039C42D5F
MRSLTLHLKILIFVLVTLGAVATCYQIFVLKVPVTETETNTLWTVEAKLDFNANNRDPVKVQMHIPPLTQDFMSMAEHFVSNNYGVTVNRSDDNRKVTWSSRRANGKQSLYYRVVLAQRYDQTDSKGPTFRDSLPVEGAEKIAVEALLSPIRQHSADLETFISEAIKRVNNTNDDNVKLLLANDTSTENKVRVLELLLSVAHVPMQRVHTLRLSTSHQQSQDLWIRSYNGKQWLYFNPETSQSGLPKDRLIWWLGDAPLLTAEGTVNKPNISYTVTQSEQAALLLKGSDASAMGYPMYELPLQSQQAFKIMVMIPIGVLVILILRNIGGLQTLGTFTPVLIALAFRETQLGYGILLFTIITALGLSLRSYLEHLKLQMLPRLSVVLTFVVILMAVISLLSYKLGIERGLSVALFPMVILTMTIERLSITWEERGGSTAFKVAIGTLIAAALAYYLMSLPQLSYFIFTFPGILLVLIGFMLAMGRYRGYRLTELFRFKAFVKE